jgi:hypothetical protein
VTFTPIVGMFLNFPPILRSLLESIWLFGLMPPHVEDYQQMLLPVVEQFEQYQPGDLGEDLCFYDIDSAIERANRIIMALVINDIRAVPLGTCGSHPPAYVGSCNLCKQGGRYHCHRMILGGAVRGLGSGILLAHLCGHLSVCLPYIVCTHW